MPSSSPMLRNARQMPGGQTASVIVMPAAPVIGAPALIGSRNLATRSFIETSALAW